MIVRMIAPDGGATHVYDHTQLNLHLARGWKVEEPEKPIVVEPKPRGRPPKVK